MTQTVTPDPHAGRYDDMCRCGHTFHEHWMGRPYNCEVSGCHCQKFSINDETMRRAGQIADKYRTRHRRWADSLPK